MKDRLGLNTKLGSEYYFENWTCSRYGQALMFVFVLIKTSHWDWTFLWIGNDSGLPTQDVNCTTHYNSDSLNRFDNVLKGHGEVSHVPSLAVHVEIFLLGGS